MTRRENSHLPRLSTSIMQVAVMLALLACGEGPGSGEDTIPG